MLRRRIEKLEKGRPLGTGDLMERWERQAMALLSVDDQVLAQAASSAKASYLKQPVTEIAAASMQRYAAPSMQRYEDALAAAVMDVSDADLDRMILILGPAQTAEATL